MLKVRFCTKKKKKKSKLQLSSSLSIEGDNYIFVKLTGMNKYQKTEKGSSDTASAGGVRLDEAINRATGKSQERAQYIAQ